MSVPEKLGEILTFLKELKPLLEKLDRGNPSTNDPNAIAAKIIKDISDKIDNNDCCKEVLDAIKSRPKTEIVPVKDPNQSKTETSSKYSFPAFGVGNEDLGSTGNSNIFTWPPKS